VLVELGGFELRSYGAFGALGFLVATFLGLRYAARRGWSRDAVIDLIFWSSLAGILGARLLYLAQNPGSFSLLHVFDLRTGGMVFYGGPMLGVPVFLAVARWRALPVAGVLDGLGIFAPLAHAFARVGCVLAGCCYGAPTELPWGIVYDHPLSLAPQHVAVHPVQLYESAGLLGISALAAWWDGRKAWDGQTGLMWLGGYAGLRFFLEVFRGDPERYFVGPLSTSQAIALGVGGLVAVVWTVISRRQRTADAS
jgi:phosphatidylglycerol:prolipoprotein diacylglycerol transferase